MANIRTCNKHNMIACVEKTEHNANFYQIVDYLTGCSINYSLLVDPDLIGLWLQQFWATASLRVINEVPHIRAMVAGKRGLISEETIRADLLFNDADGIDCFLKQVLWDSLRDIGYEGCKVLQGTAQGTPTQSAAHAIFHKVLLTSMVTADAQEVRASRSKLFSQAKQITSSRPKLKKLSKGVQPVVHITPLRVKSQNLKSKRKRRKEAKEEVFSSKRGRNKDESNCLKSINQDDHHHTAFCYEECATEEVVTPT
ncbi:hypothetical protein Tco_1148438 [Tanacetum coccineum]